MENWKNELRAKGNPGNKSNSIEAKRHRSSLLKMFIPKEQNIDKNTPMKIKETPGKLSLTRKT
jgi:hypothetical protein